MTTKANAVGRYAIVESGTVTNVILWDGNTDTWPPPEGATMVLVADDVFVEPGYAYDGKSFSGTPAADVMRAKLGL